MDCTADGMDVENCGEIDVVANRALAATPAMRINISAQAAANKPGRARFHGNGIGGGATASRRTASMTEAANPEEGRISSSRKRMRSISFSLCPTSLCPITGFIKPPSTAARPGAAEVCPAAVPAREIASPSPCPRAIPGCAPRREHPSRENKKASALRDTWPARQALPGAPLDRDRDPRALHPKRGSPPVRQCLAAERFLPGYAAVPNDRDSSPGQRASSKTRHPCATERAPDKRAERPPAPFPPPVHDHGRSGR